MKKFFSLVLALVMALSLTTVAWGATTITVGAGGTYDHDTLDAAIDAVNGLTGDVTIEVYGMVEYDNDDSGLSGTYNSITFVGKTDDAEIRMTRNGSNGYMSGTGSAPVVKFQDLILSKPGGSWAGDAGHMSVFFTVYRVAEVHYTNCVFPDGACASGCKTTYTECKFANTTSGEYSLWVYGNADVTVTGGEFTGVRGVKMYAEGRGKNSNLVMEDVVFTDSVTEKPAVVLTFGGSVELSGNTYPSKGMFELSEGSDADPNGTTITADVDDISCTSDSQADCGVLVNGKIYRNLTEADDANAIQDGSTVELFYNSNEVIELPDNVTMDANGYTNACGDDITKDANGKITSGKFDTAPAADSIAPGYVYINGEVKKISSVGNTTTYDAKDLTATKPDGTNVPTTGIISIVKVDSVTNTTTVNGVTKTTFVPAWYQIEDAGGVGTFVECDKSVADLMFTIKGVGSVFVRRMNVPAAFDATPAALYTAPKTATCGKVGANEDVYVVVNGDYYATEYTVVPGAESYALVNGKMVVYYGEATAKGHNWLQATKESYDTKTGVITSVKCPDCKGIVTVYAKAGSFDGKEYVKITEGVATNYYYVAGAVATSTGTTTGTTTGTITSADTFDAGIAMYVGMSVMAAAGSAVVIGKKKD